METHESQVLLHKLMYFYSFHRVSCCNYYVNVGDNSTLKSVFGPIVLFASPAFPGTLCSTLHVSACPLTPGVLLPLAAGFKLRKRRIINEPTGGPENCPHLVEAVACDEPSCFDWQLVGLDQCLPNEEKPCGPGTQLAQVRCVNSSGKEGRRAWLPGKHPRNTAQSRLHIQ